MGNQQQAPNNLIINLNKYQRQMPILNNTTLECLIWELNNNIDNRKTAPRREMRPDGVDHIINNMDNINSSDSSDSDSSSLGSLDNEIV